MPNKKIFAFLDSDTESENSIDSGNDEDIPSSFNKNLISN